MDTILSCCLHNLEQEETVYIPQFNHRLSLLKQWEIKQGTRLLDIGCGQGESSLVLAHAVGDSGHITGIDTALPDYGGPYTVKQSQEYIGKSVLGPRITFLRTDVASLLQSPDKAPSSVFDGAVLCHSLWYFPSRESIESVFQSLASAKISRVYLAEYAFQASLPEQVPHVLAAKAQALLHAYKAPREPGTREPNVRAAPDVAFIQQAAGAAGFKVHRQGTFTPGADLMEGHWESKYVRMDMFREHVTREKLTAEQEAEVLAYAPRVTEEIEKLSKKGISGVRTMDVWWAVLELST